jgi:hypothetical protein
VVARKALSSTLRRTRRSKLSTSSQATLLSLWISRTLRKQEGRMQLVNLNSQRAPITTARYLLGRRNLKVPP